MDNVTIMMMMVEPPRVAQFVGVKCQRGFDIKVKIMVNDILILP